MLDTLLEHVLREWRVIKDAPLAFCLAVALIGLLTFWVVGWHYSGQIGTMSQTIKYQDERLTEYRDRLGGASPQEVAAEMTAMRSRLDALSGVQWPALLDFQKDRLRKMLLLIPPQQVDIEANFPKDCTVLGNAFDEVFRSLPRWKMLSPHPLEGSIGGLGTGLALIADVRDKTNADTIGDSIHKATGLPIHVVIADQPKQSLELIVGSRP